jgi:hypothetical protein
MRVLTEAGVTLDLIEELQASMGASTAWPPVDAACVDRWPPGCVWVARKRAA